MDNIEEKSEWIRKGMNMAIEHDQPSKQTIKMIDELNTTIKLNCQSMEILDKKVDEGFRENREQHKEIMEFLQKSLEKKADKEIVDALQNNQTWMIRTIIGSVVLGIISFVFFKTGV